MIDSEVKARLAQAEVHFSHYRWDDAIACFEAVLAERPDHPLATQGWAHAIEQKNIDDELEQALGKVRISLARHEFEAALAALNQVQARGALNHILKYHSEIDGLRNTAQDGQEWQRRVKQTLREAEALARRRRFDAALEILDTLLHQLSARGWEQLGGDLTALRERLWTERDVVERVQIALAAFERQDYRLALELSGALREELPDREDVRRLHERSRSASQQVHDLLGATHEALAEERTDDALALLGRLRSEHPHNPDWQAIWLRLHMEEGRRETAAGREALVDHRFADAVEAFGRGEAAFAATAEVFEDHPVAAGEAAEAKALREVALAAAQAVRDREALRWAASRAGWQACRDRLAAAAGIRDRDLGDLAAVVESMYSEAHAIVAGLEQARISLAEGQEALAGRDAGGARDSFRAGLARLAKAGLGDDPEASALRARLSAGQREADRIQREVRKLLGQADGAKGSERLKLLERAHERWLTAPGLPERLAGELLAAAAARLESGDEDKAILFLEQVTELNGAPAPTLAQAEAMVQSIRARRAGQAALAQAAELLQETARQPLPDADLLAQAWELLDGAEEHVAQAPGLAARLAELRSDTSNQRDRLSATMAGYARTASAALARAEGLYHRGNSGDLTAIDWTALNDALMEAADALKSHGIPPAPAPPGREHTSGRLKALARRAEILRAAADRIEAGHGVEALPPLQAYAETDPDPVITAVLGRLIGETKADALTYVSARLVEAAASLARGELAAAEALLQLAGNYATTRPEVIPELRRIERRAVVLAEIRATVSEARAHANDGRVDEALGSYRHALQLATDGEAGLAADVRRKLTALLQLEDELHNLRPGEAGDGATTHPEATLLLEEVVATSSEQPVLVEFVVPALLSWWKGACRADDLARVEAQLLLGRAGEARKAAARLVERLPRDRAAAELYRRAAGEWRERFVTHAGRHAERAGKLADRGAYERALDELDRVDTLALGDPDAAAEDAVAMALAEAEDLRLNVQAMMEAASRLAPLVSAMREHALAGERGEALAARRRAEYVDPQRSATSAWQELDRLAALTEAGQPAPGAGVAPGMPAQAAKAWGPGASGRGAPSHLNGGPAEPAFTAEARVERPAPPVEPPVAPPEPRSQQQENAPPAAAPVGPLSSAPDPGAAQPPPSEVEPEGDPPAPFDLEDWLSNVTELEPEEGEPRA